MTQPENVLNASRLFQNWLAALKQRAALSTHNESQAMFRSVLHNLRRHMTIEQVLTFADILPPLPRGIFIEGWRPAEPLPLSSAADFLDDLVRDLSPHHRPNDSIAADVFAVLAQSLPPSDASAMRDQLPAPLRPLWPETPA